MLELNHREDCYVSTSEDPVSQKHCSCGRFQVLALLKAAEEYIEILESCQDGYYRACESKEAKRYQTLCEKSKS